MILTSYNTRANITQYLNNEELERLKQVHLKHILMTEKIKTTIDFCTKKIELSIQ